jgi:hypothetical protein
MAARTTRIVVFRFRETVLEPEKAIDLRLRHLQNLQETAGSLTKDFGTSHPSESSNGRSNSAFHYLQRVEERDVPSWRITGVCSRMSRPQPMAEPVGPIKL